MAVINPTISSALLGKGDGATVRLIWTPVTENDTCAPAYLPEYSDKSVQVFGTFGGASVAIQGSNDGGTTYAVLHDPSGTAIAVVVAGFKAVLENTEYFKPVATGGVAQSLSIAMLVRVSTPMRT